MSADRVLLAGVLGDPVAHSRSPQLHGHWLRRYAVTGHYVPLHVRPQDMAQVLHSLPRMGFSGVNVTLPHKEAVLALAAEATPAARRIGAANTLTFLPEGRFIADNTDAYGFLENLRQGAPDWQATDGPALVFGAGGASRAVVVGLLDAGVPEVRLCNRTLDRAAAMAREFGPAVVPVAWEDAARTVAGSALVVNTTSLGMHGAPPFPDVLQALDPSAVAADIVYVPLETPFLRLARARGARCVDGLGMLLHQAVPGFERWFGRRPEVDEALRKAVLA
jgi:shikimate dehydrogenase